MKIGNKFELFSIVGILFLCISCEHGDGISYQAHLDAQETVDNLEAAGYISVIDKYEVKEMLDAKYQEVILRERGK